MTYEYSVLQSRDFDGAARVLVDAFSRREPLGQAVGVTAAEFDALVRVLAPKVIAEQLTIVARDGATGDVVGVMLNEDSATPPPDGLDGLGDKFAPIFEFLHGLEVKHRAGIEGPKLGEWLHLFLLAVAEDACRRGVAQGLVGASLENGIRRGYRKAVTEATGPVSQNVFRKLGFVDCVRGEYAGHPVFGSVAYAGGTILMEKRL